MKTLQLHSHYYIGGFITINKNDKLRYMGYYGGLHSFLTDNAYEHLLTDEQLKTATVTPA